uniref:uncharacterized protein LOC120347209 n=1 Tax=Styela clava TaxID=7725 RepID=UPI00193A19CB|nr:uncharacterized protein LOC120347209 [Styela clava]
MEEEATTLPPVNCNDEEIEIDYRRWSDNILHWQERPYVYPFSDTEKGKTVQTAPAANRYTSMYSSDFVPKAISVRRLRPTSINRLNKPHPRSTYHMNLVTNKSVPVVRTRMTMDDLNRKSADSPLISNTHRTYRGKKLTSAEKTRVFKDTGKAAEGIVPEIPKEGERIETRLFPCIPRNARLTADRATKITNAVIKPQANKKQPHLKGSISAIMRGEKYTDGPVYPYLPVKDLNRHALKPLTGRSDTMRVSEWDGAPRSNAKTTQAVYGRKRESVLHIEARIDAVVPDVPAPTSKQLMFKEYAQYPKYAPQMLEGYYNSMHIRRLVRPHAW